MTRCCRCLLVVLASIASLAASYRTTNFMVEASDEKIAKKVGDSAERYRKELALKWLGEELPPWGRRCPIKVTVTSTNSGAATSFAFDGGKVLSMDMHIEGKVDRLIASALPHEIAHTVFAYHFRAPVPRWADEGGAILAEDEQERSIHERMVRDILRTSRGVPLRRLFSFKDYPRDVMVLYAEGYSISRFLVESRDHKTFLAFVADGMKGDWDKASEEHYGYPTIEEMEKSWLKWLSAKESRGDKDTSKGRIQVLEAEVRLLQLENQLLRVQVANAHQAAEDKKEQERLQKKIRRARRMLEQRRREVELPSPFVPLTGEMTPISPGLPAVPTPPKP